MRTKEIYAYHVYANCMLPKSKEMFARNYHCIDEK